MNKILNGLLRNNVVEIMYMPLGRTPSLGLFTTNNDFIKNRDFKVDVDQEPYFRAFELLRNKEIVIENDYEIMETKVHNPSGAPATQLYSAKSNKTLYDVDKMIDAFKKAYIKPLCEIGDPFKLSLTDKKILIDLHLATGMAREMSHEEANAHIEDLNFTSPVYRVMNYIRYGYFFAMDYDWKSDKEAMLFAIKKWVSLIEVYKKLHLQVAQTESFIDSLNAIVYPAPEKFTNYHQIIDYWPYPLSPRPQGLLDCNAMNSIFENQESMPSI
jgi:hypothetical protein